MDSFVGFVVIALRTRFS